MEPGNDLPHLGGHYASQAGMDFEVLVKEACFTVFDTIYENLCVLAPGVNNARLFTLLADQLGNDDTPQDRYEQVFGRHTYNIWSADRRVRRKNIESLQAEFAHYTQAWEDHKGWTKAKLFAVLFE